MPATSDRPVVRAAGTVLWRRNAAARVEIAVIHRPRYDDWSLPKGKCDRGETLPACAVRETEEESGYRPVLGRRLPDVRYAVGQPARSKVIWYFAGRATDGEFRPNEEVDELRWLPPEEAKRVLSYPDALDTLDAFGAVPPDARTVLLVRHAKAGSRQNWSGDDDARPLSPAGWRQAKALRTLLPLFGVRRVAAAPRLRCEQTVAGLAEDLGVPLVREPLLSEEAHVRAPTSAARRLLRLVGPVGGATEAGFDPPDGPIAVCSQGGAIPGLIDSLAAESGLALPPGPLPCKKGSVWVLSFAPRPPYPLLAADYLPSPLPPPEGA